MTAQPLRYRIYIKPKIIAITAGRMNMFLEKPPFCFGKREKIVISTKTIPYPERDVIGSVYKKACGSRKIMDTGLLMAGELRTRTVNRAAFHMTYE